jgi:hypothetical protein
LKARPKNVCFFFKWKIKRGTSEGQKKKSNDFKEALKFQEVRLAERK